VTRAMELSPQAPSFLEERDAILIADGVAYGGADRTTIWKVFAHRGMGFFASARSTFDTHPVESFSLPVTCPGSGCGTVFGQVVDPTSDAPVSGVLVHLAPDDLGVPVDLSATTDANGRFRIADVPDGSYRNVTVSGDGYRTVWFGPVNVDGDTHLHPEIRRDWVTISGGARVQSVTGQNRATALGECGPQGILDGSLTTSWLTSIKQPAVLTVKLPTAVNISDIEVDPSAICAGASSNTRSFRILTRTLHGKWTVAFATSVGLATGRLTTLRPNTGWHDVRFVRLELRSAARSSRQVEFTELIVHGPAAVPST
jgi:extracellular elastinolytic metalloproteinase